MKDNNNRGVFAFKGGTFWSDCNGFSLFDVIAIAMVFVYLLIVYMAVAQESLVAIDIQSNFNHLMIVIIGVYGGDQITARVTSSKNSHPVDRRTPPPTYQPPDYNQSQYNNMYNPPYSQDKNNNGPYI